MISMPSSALPSRYPSRRVLGILTAVCLIVCTIVLLSVSFRSTYSVSFAPIKSLQGVSQRTAPPPVTSGRSSHESTSVAGSLIRLDQSQQGQYLSQAQYVDWWESACSAASMTEILNSYLHQHYKIGDILRIEASFQNPSVISTNAGLLYPEGIDRTMAAFGLSTTRLTHPSIAQIVGLAHTGAPVLVNFPPGRSALFPGGHFLVVIGGTSSMVTLADSSRLNLHSLPYATFAQYWAGFADVFSVTQQDSVLGKPTVSAAFLNQVLAYYGSPAAGKGQALYDLGVKYGIDPAYALAFFGHESTFGTHGEATKTMSLGNLRCISSRPCVDQSLGGGYAQMQSWEDGFEVWYQLIRNLYVTQWGATTVDLIIPHYAPSSDNNDEAAYIRSIQQSVLLARAGNVAIEQFS